jgi:hypothetical protein
MSFHLILLDLTTRTILGKEHRERLGLEGENPRRVVLPNDDNFNTLRTGIFFLYINHKSLIQSKDTFF